MSVSPTPGQVEYVSDNATESRANGTSVLGVPREFNLRDLMRLLSLVIVLAGLVGNGTVLWLLRFPTRRNPFSTYILNLAWADTFFLCCCFLILIDEFAKYSYYYLMRAVLKYLTNVFYNVGISLLAAISTVRCLAVLFPSWYLHHHPKSTSAVVCTVIWALPGLFLIEDVVSCIYGSMEVVCEVFGIHVASLIHLTLVLWVSSLTLVLRVQCSSQQHREPPRLYILVLLMVLVFLLCGLPCIIQDTILGFSLHFIPYWLVTLLNSLKSSAYPFIYFLLGIRRHRRSRESLNVILQGVLADEQELEGGRRNSCLTNTQETSF